MCIRAAGVVSVGEYLAVQVDKDVDVNGAAGVPAWEDGIELRDTLAIGVLQTAQHGIVEIASILRADAVSLGDDAAVDAGGVAVWEVLVRLAGE